MQKMCSDTYSQRSERTKLPCSFESSLMQGWLVGMCLVACDAVALWWHILTQSIFGVNFRNLLLDLPPIFFYIMNLGIRNMKDSLHCINLFGNSCGKMVQETKCFVKMIKSLAPNAYSFNKLKMLQKSKYTHNWLEVCLARSFQKYQVVWHLIKLEHMKRGLLPCVSSSFTTRV